MLIMLAGTFFSAISQVLLKQSANMEYKNPLREYLNWRVILAYGIFFGAVSYTHLHFQPHFCVNRSLSQSAAVLLFILTEQIPRGNCPVRIKRISAIHIQLKHICKMRLQTFEYHRSQSEKQDRNYPEIDRP